MDLAAVPFSYDYMRQPDYTTITVMGVLRTESEGLAIEFRERTYFAMSEEPVDGSIRTLVIPWSDLQSVRIREPWLLRPRLVLRTRSLRALDGLPEAEGTEVTLPIARADRGLARELAANIEAALAEQHLRALAASDSPPALDLPESPRALPPS